MRGLVRKTDKVLLFVLLYDERLEMLMCLRLIGVHVQSR